jgi:hypothetical protein
VEVPRPHQGAHHRRGALTRGALGFALGLGLLWAGPATAQNACQVERHTFPAHRSGARPPLVIGDSGFLLAAPELARLGLEADARGCRAIAAATGVLAARRHTHTLPRIVVLGIGANGGDSYASLRRALAVVGPHRLLGLVTTPASASSDLAMRRLASRWPQRVFVIEWAGSGIPQRFGGDGIHIGPTAETILARFVWRRVRPYLPPRSLRLPARKSAAKPCGVVHRARRALAVFITHGKHRVTCRRARQIVRARAPERVAGWQWFDWQVVGRRPWTDVFVRPSGKVVVAAAPAPRKP